MAEGGAGPSKQHSVDDDAKLAELLSGPGFAIYPLPWCPHLETGVKDNLPEDISTKNPCNWCGDSSENWLCLGCHVTHCSRYVNGHQVEHHSQSSHPLALSFSDLSVWCFDCDSYVDNQVLYDVKNLAHKDKFNGEEMLKPDYGDGSGGGGGLTFELV